MVKEKIIIRDLWKSFGDKEILKGVNLTVMENEILCVLGKSGTGKSVILKHLTGILSPDSGKIIVDGIDYTNSGESEKDLVRLKFGILFQGAALFDSMNVYDNVAFGLRRTNIAEDEIKKMISPMLEEVGLRGIEDKMPSDLSGGMQKRVGLARAVIMRPEIMLYDEPTTGVDPITGGAVDRLIMSTREKHSVTSIVVTHDIQSALRIADRIAVLLEGQIIFTGTPEEIRESHDPFVNKFIQARIDGPA